MVAVGAGDRTTPAAALTVHPSYPSAAEGYAATTLAAVDRSAGVGARTVYVRFGTKAGLLTRTVEVALVGDTDPVDLRSRAGFQLALSAPTRQERVEAFARHSRDVMARAGQILAVAQQAAAVEPEIAAAAQAGREATGEAVREFWASLDVDGLAPANCDIEWLTATTSVLGQADTYHLVGQTLGLSIDEYERWLKDTWTRLLCSAAIPADEPDA